VVQYLYIAYLIYYYNGSRLYILLVYLFLILVTYCIYSILTLKKVYYGIGTMNSWEPAISGSKYLFCTIWLHFRLQYISFKFTRYTYKLFLRLGTICVFLTVSRTRVIAILAYFLCLFCFAIL